jgi:hypothetical protein
MSRYKILHFHPAISIKQTLKHTQVKNQDIADIMIVVGGGVALRF